MVVRIGLVLEREFVGGETGRQQVLQRSESAVWGGEWRRQRDVDGWQSRSGKKTRPGFLWLVSFAGTMMGSRPWHGREKKVGAAQVLVLECIWG